MKFNHAFGGVVVLMMFFVVIYVTVIHPQINFQPAPTEVAHRYTDLEWRGREIYKREGCWYCHSQFTRPQDRGMGELVQPGDYVYETPHLLGSERTGPDLSNEGGKFPDEWHRAHHRDPRSVSPGSIMPSFSYLERKMIPYRDEGGSLKEIDEMGALIAYIQTLGVQRKQPGYVVAPWEYRFDNPNNNAHIYSKVMTKNPVGENPEAIHSGRGIFLQNCAICHGIHGEGNGPASVPMAKKPADFTRPFYAQYPDDFWFFRVSEGVPGTRMPRWESTLTEEQIWYVVAYLRTLPKKGKTKIHGPQSITILDKAIKDVKKDVP